VAAAASAAQAGATNHELQQAEHKAQHTQQQGGHLEEDGQHWQRRKTGQTDDQPKGSRLDVWLWYAPRGQLYLHERLRLGQVEGR
jgi:hypothetical protein